MPPKKEEPFIPSKEIKKPSNPIDQEPPIIGT